VLEGERGRDRAVRPPHLPAGLDEYASPGQVGEDRFDVFVGLLGGGRDFRRRERSARDRRAAEHGLVCGREAVGGVLDEQADTVGDRVGELGEGPGGDDRTGSNLEPTSSQPIVQEVFGEQGHTACALMDELHQIGVGLAAQPGSDQRPHFVDRQRVEHDQRGPLPKA
jgi:hypothetical protein